MASNWEFVLEMDHQPSSVFLFLLPSGYDETFGFSRRAMASDLEFVLEMDHQRVPLDLEMELFVGKIDPSG
ncbi:hypothetical protein NL676_017397 [Syzygium grande]|nr:hypothetical protein NL676_017397 [Syzygium grande]